MSSGGVGGMVHREVVLDFVVELDWVFVCLLVCLLAVWLCCTKDTGVEFANISVAGCIST